MKLSGISSVFIGRLLFIIVTISLCGSCVNTIHEEEESNDSQDKVDYPIRFSKNALYAQLYGNDCEQRIGVYLLSPDLPLSDVRLISNQPFSPDSTGFSPLKSIFFPNKNRCNLTAYYPYSEQGIATGNTQLKVSTQIDQRTLSAYNLSDFQTAEQSGITPSAKPIKLTFKHRMCKLSVQIIPQDGDKASSYDKSLFSVCTSGLYTQSNYNFSTQEFSALQQTASIQMHGDWVVRDGVLTGPSCLVIPQQVKAGTEILILNDGKHKFSCRLAEDVWLESSKTFVLKVRYNQAKGLEDFTADVREWEEGNSSVVIPEEKVEKDGLTANDFSFSRSSIFHVYAENKEVACVCKEYLNTGFIQSQAIVAYPVKDSKPDFSSGLVVELFGEKRPLHGGIIKWNAATNSYTYKIGSHYPGAFLYYTTGGKLTLDKPQQLLPLSIKPMLLVDSREDESLTYPLVKIGMQLWMRKNLMTRRYTNGKAMARKTKKTYSNTKAGYFENEEEVFYNRTVLESGNVTPLGWKVPSLEDWQVLCKYLSNKAGLLKASISLWENSIFETSNKSDFTALPTGLFTKSNDKEMSVFGYFGKYAAFWAMESHTEMSKKILVLSADREAAAQGRYDDYSAVSIRCIKSY